VAGRLDHPITNPQVRQQSLLPARGGWLKASTDARITRRPHAHFLLWSLGLAEAGTQTSQAERDCLARHASGRRRLVEIGVWHGVTTRRLRAAMAPDGLLFAVDPYPIGRFGFSPQFLMAQAEVQAVSNGSVRWLRMTSVEAGREFVARGEESVDFIFIDGDHTYEGLRGDWQTWSPLVAPEGIVAVHDSRSTPGNRIDDAGSVIFTREVIQEDPRYEVVETVDSLTVLRRGMTRQKQSS
jgi:predicted O-methyltransferase YrrM